jgi:hypothetical protein
MKQVHFSSTILVHHYLKPPSPPPQRPFAFFRNSSSSSSAEEPLPKMAAWSESNHFDNEGEVFGGDVSPRSRKRNRLE